MSGIPGIIAQVKQSRQSRQATDCGRFTQASWLAIDSGDGENECYRAFRLYRRSGGSMDYGEFEQAWEVGGPR